MDQIIALERLAEKFKDLKKAIKNTKKWKDFIDGKKSNRRKLMEIYEIREVVNSWESKLSVQQKRYIHYNSFSNFIYHFEKLKDERTKEIVSVLLEEYIRLVTTNDFLFDADTGHDIANRFMIKIREYYSGYYRFYSKIKFSDVVIWGGMGDVLLYLCGFNQKMLYIPTLTSLLFVYCLVILLIVQPQKRVCGLFF